VFKFFPHISVYKIHFAAYEFAGRSMKFGGAGLQGNFLDIG
jgi:hypothetical protein